MSTTPTIAQKGNAMKKLIGVVVFVCAAPAFAQTYVDSYTRKDGTYVPGHYRSSPDDSRSNNYSTQGNVNPYTGRQGTVNPYGQGYNTPNYGVPQQQTPYNNGARERRSSYR
jgi:hypothetical protein